MDDLTVFSGEQALYLRVLADTGTSREALAAAGVDRATLRGWKNDPTFCQAVTDATAEYTDKLFRKGLEAVEQATGEQLVNHPVAWMFSLKALDERFKENPRVTFNDGRQQILLLSDERRRQIEEALLGPVPTDAALGL